MPARIKKAPHGSGAFGDRTGKGGIDPSALPAEISRRGVRSTTWTKCNGAAERGKPRKLRRDLRQSNGRTPACVSAAAFALCAWCRSGFPSPPVTPLFAGSACRSDESPILGSLNPCRFRGEARRRRRTAVHSPRSRPAANGDRNIPEFSRLEARDSAGRNSLEHRHAKCDPEPPDTSGPSGARLPHLSGLGLARVAFAILTIAAAAI